MSATVVITVGGTDYSADVMFSGTRFVSQTNGQPGDGALRIRDEASAYSFTIGQVVLLTIDGDAAWRGFVSQVTRSYAFDAATTDPMRIWTLGLVGINILFQRRIVFNQVTPDDVYGTLFAANTNDSAAIADLVANFLDLTGDGIDTSTLVETVGALDPAQASRAWSGGFTWAEAMTSIAMVPAAIYYLSPTLAGADLVYTDVDTPNAPFGLSDQPDGTTTKGYSEMEVLFDGSTLANDVMCWGIGYGSADPVFVRDEDATSQTTHGRWQYAQVSPGVFEQATIDRIAASIIDGSPTNQRGRKDDREAVILTTYHAGLLPGHKVPFTSAVFGYTATLPVRKSEITFLTSTQPKWVLTLSLDIDAPWGFVDQFLFNLPGIVWPGLRFLPPSWIFPRIGSDCVCGITDTFTRVVASGWGTSDSTLLWAAGSSNASSASVNGVAGLIAYAPNLAVWPVLEQGKEMALEPPTATTSGQVVIRQASATFVSCQLLFVEFSGADEGEIILGMGTGSISATDERNRGNCVQLYDTTLGWQAVAYTWGTGSHNVKWELVDTVARVRVWAVGDPEPGTWTLEVDQMSYEKFPGVSIWYLKATEDDGISNGYIPGTVDYVGPPRTEFGYHGNETANTIYIDDLDIPGVDRCTEYRFDNFDRTETGQWGDTPDGHTWFTLSSPSDLGVSGNEGWMDLASPSDIGIVRCVPEATNPWTSDFEMTALLEYSTGLQINDDLSFMFYMEKGSNVYVQLYLAGMNNLPSVLYVYDGTFAHLDSYDIPSANPIQGTPIWLKWKRVSATGQLQAKVWWGTDVEPGWQVSTIASNVTGDAGSTDGLVAQWSSSNSVGARRMSMDYIDFDYPGKLCYEAGPPPGAPAPTGSPSGKRCEEATALSTTQYQTSIQYAPGTTEVYVDGLRQRPGIAREYTEDSGHTTITFNSPVSGSAVVVICYFVAYAPLGGGRKNLLL